VSIDLHAATPATTTLARGYYYYLVAAGELLWFHLVGLPNVVDVRAPAHDALVTLVYVRVEHAIGQVEAHGRIEQVGEQVRSLTSPRGQEPTVMSQMGHTTANLTLAIYAREMNRRDGEPERLKALIEGREVAPSGTTGTQARPTRQTDDVTEASESLSLQDFSLGPETGLEPVTPCLQGQAGGVMECRAGHHPASRRRSSLAAPQREWRRAVWGMFAPR
jgi:hypothetical protein